MRYRRRAKIRYVQVGEGMKEKERRRR